MVNTLVDDRQINGRIGQQGVWIDTPIEQTEVSLEVVPLRLLNVRITPMALVPDFAEEHGVFAVITGGAIAIVVGKLGKSANICAVLQRADKDDAGHAHGHMLNILHVAVIHVGSRITWSINIGKELPNGNRDRTGWLAIEEGNHIAEAMPVQCVSIGQVRPQLQTQIG